MSAQPAGEGRSLDGFLQAWEGYRRRTEAALEQRLPPANLAPTTLHRAIRYACLDGGKRFRAMLVYSCGEAAGAAPELMDAPACALEMIHAYSLVHDDLPAMDDDVMRRGRPTCHMAFGEATAILAGDTLQTLAFETLTDEQMLSPSCRLKMVKELARASGNAGMAGGQALDVEATGRSSELLQLQEIHQLKTGALIRAAAALGALAGGADEAMRRAFDRYAGAIGLAYQVVDDILDETQDSETLGKSSGADMEMEKSTYTRLLGVDSARKTAESLHAEALESLNQLSDNTKFLEELADFVLNRNY